MKMALLRLAPLQAFDDVFSMPKPRRGKKRIGVPQPHGVKKSFDNYRFEYGITNPNGKDLARIDFFSGEVKVGQTLFGDAIAPGSFASLMQDEIDLFFPLTHFANILNLLQTQKSLSLFVDVDPDSHQVTGGGIMAVGSRKNR
jgi:hypothetical protein